MSGPPVADLNRHLRGIGDTAASGPFDPPQRVRTAPISIEWD
jgi:hypothetical protein